MISGFTLASIFVLELAAISKNLVSLHYGQALWAYIGVFVILAAISLASFVSECIWTYQAQEVSKGNLHSHLAPLTPFARCNDSLDFAMAMEKGSEALIIDYPSNILSKALGMIELLLLCSLAVVLRTVFNLQGFCSEESGLKASSSKIELQVIIVDNRE